MGALPYLSLGLLPYFMPFFPASISHQPSLVLAVDIALSAQAAYLFYKDRWPVEQPPLVTKQLIGCKRAFVHNSETIFRLPELALLAGNILTYIAAVSPTIPSGFWDRNPKKRQVAFAGL